MMVYLPDTNVWIRHLESKPSRVKDRLAAYDPNDVLLCDIVKAELYYGAFKSARPADNLAVLKSLFASFESVPFTGDTARVFGKLRSDLAQQGSPIGPLDLQIASIAALNGLNASKGERIKRGTHQKGNASKGSGLFDALQADKG